MAVQEYTKQYINGEWVTSTNGAKSLIDVYDSNTGEVFARAPKGSTADTAKAIEVRLCHCRWSHFPAPFIQKAADTNKDCQLLAPVRHFNHTYKRKMWRAKARPSSTGAYLRCGPCAN
jgi:hypothetical protein